jgi:hypothetical protein
MLLRAPANAAPSTRGELVRRWKAAHADRPDVRIIERHGRPHLILTTPGSCEPVLSLSVFVYRDGRSPSIYSPHSIASS